MSAVLALAPTKSVAVNVLPGTYSHTAYDPQAAQVVLSVNTDGTVSITGDFPQSYQWLSGGLASDYEVKFETVSGVPNYGLADTWQALTNNRAIGVVADGPDVSSTFTFTIKIRRVGTVTDLDSAEVTISAVSLA